MVRCACGKVEIFPPSSATGGASPQQWTRPEGVVREKHSFKKCEGYVVVKVP